MVFCKTNEHSLAWVTLEWHAQSRSRRVITVHYCTHLFNEVWNSNSRAYDVILTFISVYTRCL